MVSPTIFILIPTFNRKALLQQCLESFLTQTYRPIEIVVMDDGSTDGTRELLESYTGNDLPLTPSYKEGGSFTKMPKVVRLEGQGHWWWTGAMRAGVEYVLERAEADDYILTMNDDAVVERDYLEKMMGLKKTLENLWSDPFSSQEKVRMRSSKKRPHPSPLPSWTQDYSLIGEGITPRIIVGSVCYSDQKRTRVIEPGRKINWAKDGGFGTPLELQKDLETQQLVEVDTLSGKGNLVPVEVFKRIGNFSIALPHYGADYEFFIRAKRAGYHLFLSYQTPVYNLNEDGGRTFLKEKTRWQRFWQHNFSKRSKGNIWYRAVYVWQTNPWQYRVSSWLSISYDFLGSLWRLIR